MPRRLPLALLSVLFFLPLYAHAQVAITEIMYDAPGADTGHEWIEVQNTGSAPIDLAAKDIRLVVGTDKHLIKAGSGASVLAPQGIAIIASDPATFQSDYPSFKGSILKSSFTLTANGSIAIARTDGTILGSAGYSSADGAKGDGNSLQLAEKSYIAGAPTPGIVPATPPAAIAKPSADAGSSSKKVTNNAYAEGSKAPAAPAIAGAAGASSWSLLPAQFLETPLMSSPYFAAYLALLAFSLFSLIVIVRYA